MKYTLSLAVKSREFVHLGKTLVLRNDIVDAIFTSSSFVKPRLTIAYKKMRASCLIVLV